MAGLAGDLCWPLDKLHGAASQPSFGAAWAMLENQCPGLAMRAVPTGDLEGQIAIASRILSGVHRPVAPARYLAAAD